MILLQVIFFTVFVVFCCHKSAKSMLGQLPPVGGNIKQQGLPMNVFFHIVRN